VVPDATIVVTNIGTNEQLRLTTSANGAFSAPLLDPVEYRIAVEAPGFKRSLLEKVKVDTAVTATVNITLEAGQISNEVNVTAEVPVLNAESGTPGQTITEREIVEMPLNNRSVLDLALTVAGVAGVAGNEDPELDSGTIPAPGFNVSVNGGRAGSTAILADGARNTGVGLGRAVVTFSPDTVQEFTVQTSNFSAEYGQSGGGVINMSTKSGTNQYSGLLYWYHRNPTLDAAPFTIATNNRPQSNRRQHQFGFILGGPVQLPRWFGPLSYNGHDKTFFFAAVEPRYYYDGTPFTALMPTPSMLRGDFSGLVGITGGYAPADVVNRFGLQSQVRDATLYNQWVVTGNQFQQATLPAGATFPAFNNNAIPSNMLDPVSMSLLKYLPTAGDYFLFNGNLQNYSGSTFIKNLEKRITVKLDQQIGGRNHLSGRYTQVPVRGDRGRGDFQVGRDEVNSGGTDYSWSKQVLLTDTHTFSPRVISEVRLNYTYGRFTRNLPPAFDAISGRNFSTEIGLPSLTHGGLPEIVTGVGSIGFSQSQQNENTEHSYEIANTISWVRGSQSWKFGADLLKQRLKTIPLFGASGGRFEFNRNRTLTNSTGTTTGTGGIEFAQFLLGTYNLATLRDILIPYYYQWNSASGFVQNSWKARPNLTLEIGLRYSVELPRTEKYDHQGTFLPELAKSYPIPQPCPQCILPDGRAITQALVIPFGYSGRAGRSRYIFPVEKNGFEPRFGFAWSPGVFGWNKESRLVIRGGYGLYHVPLTGTNRNPSPDFASGTTGYGTFDLRVENPGTNIPARICCNRPVLRPQTPDQYLNIPTDGLVYLPGVNIAGTVVSPNAHIPYVQSWSASVSYEPRPNTVVEFSYRGAKGTRLFLPPTNINPIPADVTDAYLSRGLNPFLPVVNDPLGRLNPSGAPITFSPAYIGSKYLGFQMLNEEYDASADSTYHAGTASLQRRFSKGLSFTANYTFAKSLDDASDSGDVRFVNLNVRSPGYVNLGAPRYLDHSVSLFDIKHAFAATALYELPFGRGRLFFSNAPRVIERMIGSWSLSGVGRIQGGLPMTVVLRDDNGLGVLNPAVGNLRTIRPDVVPGVTLLNPRWSRNCPIGQLCEPYFNPAAFERPVKGTLGNGPRTFDNARGPAQQFFDLSLQKDFRLGEDRRRRLQFRVDAINAFNHPIFRIGRLEDAGEIFAAPNEATLTNAEYDAWAAFSAARPARSSPAGTALMTSINNLVVNNRIAGTQSLRPDFFHVPVPEGFFSLNANSFDVTTVQGLQLYRLRQAYTPDRWGYLDVTPGRSGYSPRFIQIALKLYF
jgi:hypothetical protein